jgi:hypothetical protein
MIAKKDRVAWYKQQIKVLQDGIEMLRSGTLTAKEQDGGLDIDRVSELIEDYNRAIEGLTRALAEAEKS